MTDKSAQPEGNTSPASPTPKAPLGTLMLVGGGYPPLKLSMLKERLPHIPHSECDPAGIYRELLARSGKKAPVVEIITSASEHFATETAEEHELLLRHLGAAKVHTTSSRGADTLLGNKQLLTELAKADIVFFTGGDQEDLARFFNNTEIHALLRKRYAEEKDFVLGGSSAGAMIMARKTINGNNKQVEGGCPPIIEGFAMLPLVVETHMDSANRKSRERRLLQAVLASPGNIGIGMDNATAAMITNGAVTILGEGRVLVVHSPSSGISNKDHQIAPDSLRECADFAKSPLRVHEFHKGNSGFSLGSFNHMPEVSLPKITLAASSAPEFSVFERLANMINHTLKLPYIDLKHPPRISLPATQFRKQADDQRIP